MTLTPIELVRQRASERSAAFIEAHIGKALLFNRKPHLHNYVATLIEGDGLAIECGVFKDGLRQYAVVCRTP